MKYIVTEDHRTEFPNPIKLEKGEKVITGETSEETIGETQYDENWPNWTFCAKMDGSNKGWVPNQIIKCEDNFGYIIEDYSAKELDIDSGAVVKGIKELNGWLWAENEKEEGWIPVDKVRKVE
ncbi:MAG: SH3 domain-containing protein [Spirochaetaceae bacterium]|nr:SH3 domain-containing protein [Spirochaetaceae bacterium]